MKPFTDKIINERKQLAAQFFKLFAEAKKSFNGTQTELLNVVGMNHFTYQGLRQRGHGRPSVLRGPIEKLRAMTKPKPKDMLDKALEAPKTKKVRVVSGPMTLEEFNKLHAKLKDAAEELASARENYEALRNRLMTAEI